MALICRLAHDALDVGEDTIPALSQSSSGTPYIGLIEHFMATHLRGEHAPHRIAEATHVHVTDAEAFLKNVNGNAHEVLLLLLLRKLPNAILGDAILEARVASFHLPVAIAVLTIIRIGGDRLLLVVRNRIQRRIRDSSVCIPMQALSR